MSAAASGDALDRSLDGVDTLWLFAKKQDLEELDADALQPHQEKRKMLWAIYCIGKPNTASVRAANSKEHKAYLDKYDAALSYSAGLQNDDASEFVGSMFILNANSRAEAKAFIEAEPYYKADMFEKVIISRLSNGRFKVAAT